MPIVEPLKSYYIKHDNTQDAFTFRIRLIAETIVRKKNECFWRELALKILKTLPRNLPRQYYDIEAAKTIYTWIRERVPFRKDPFNVETIQYPEVTLEFGGDCDCQVVLASVLLLNSGVNCQLIVSKQGSRIFDHIALYIPSTDSVFDLTAPGGFPMDTNKLNQPKLINISLNTGGECNG